MTYDDVRELGLALPGVEDSTWYGTAALKVKGKAMCRLKEDGETLVLCTGNLWKDHLLKEQPDVFYITDHYRGWPGVLVRLPVADPELIQDLLLEVWRQLAPERLVREFDAEQ